MVWLLVGVCVSARTAAVFLFLTKCDLASGCQGYWFQAGRRFGLQHDLDLRRRRFLRIHRAHKQHITLLGLFVETTLKCAV